MKRNTIILVRGLPGSGKTTVAEIFDQDYWTDIFSADDYFYQADGSYKFDPSKLHQAHKTCLENTRESLTLNDDVKHARVVVHNTFTTEKEIKPYRNLAEELDCNLISLIVENRHGNSSVHGVPDETMEKMRNRFSVKI